jgi:hypothetical protein
MSSEALAKPTITKNSSEFKLDTYASLPTIELVVFAVQVLQADAAPVAVEEVVSTCFRFFPHSFALKNYFYWPDSALVTRRLHDAKEKGFLKGSPADGFEVKGKGRQVARHVAKTLGVSLPVPPKVEVPTPAVTVPVEKKEEVAAPPVVVEKQVEVPAVTQPEKAITKATVKKAPPKQKEAAKKKPAAKKQAVKPKVKAKKETAKVVAPVKKKPSPKPQPKAQPKKTVKPAVKAKTQVKKKESKPASKPQPQAKRVTKVETPKKEAVKTAPAPKVDKPKAQKAQSAQPTQLTMSLTPPAAWKKAEVPATKPKVKEEAPAKVEVLAPVAASKEEKDKAAKVIKQIERSDAYQLYRRNGKRAQIGEFDFRNMLFATMESSAETLKRNLELFKRYAGIHFRTDLIAFLEFCEENFAELMKPKAKLKR